YLVLCATVLGQGIWTFLLSRYPAGVVAPYSLLVPVLGIALAFVLLAERPSWVELVAGVVIVGGVLLGTPRPAPVAVPESLPGPDPASVPGSRPVPSAAVAESPSPAAAADSPVPAAPADSPPSSRVA